MHTLLKLKTITSTKIESILNDVVVHHCVNPNELRKDIVSSDIKAHLKDATLDDVMQTIQVATWGETPIEGLTYCQYIALENDSDIEVILRRGSHGCRTAIFIETDKDDDDNYDNAVVYVFYSGGYVGVYEELFTLGVTEDNIEKHIGDQIILDKYLPFVISKEDVNYAKSIKAQNGELIDIDLN